MPAGELRGDDRLRQPGLSHRVVPLPLHGAGDQAQGEVVLPQVSPDVQEAEIISCQDLLY